MRAGVDCGRGATQQGGTALAALARDLWRIARQHSGVPGIRHARGLRADAAPARSVPKSNAAINADVKRFSIFALTITLNRPVKQEASGQRLEARD